MGNNHIMDILGNYMEMLERENDSLKGLISAKHIKRNEDSNLIAELKLAIVDQNDDIKTLKVDNKWLANRNGEIIKEKDAWINDLKAEIKELKDVIIKDLECDLKQAIKLRDKFGQERDDNRKNIDILKMEIKTLKQNNHYKMNLTMEIDELNAEIKELKKCSNVAFVEVLNRSNDKLKAENDSLKVKLNNGENCDHEWYNDLKDVIKSLEEENDSLKDEAVKWNRKYNKVLESRETFKDEGSKPTFH